jgi:hypothetical protein
MLWLRSSEDAAAGVCHARSGRDMLWLRGLWASSEDALSVPRPQRERYAVAEELLEGALSTPSVCHAHSGRDMLRLSSAKALIHRFNCYLCDRSLPGIFCNGPCCLPLLPGTCHLLAGAQSLAESSQQIVRCAALSACNGLLKDGPCLVIQASFHMRYAEFSK